MPRKKDHPTRGKTLAKDLLTDDEMTRLLEACGDGDSAVRNRALIAMMSGTGIRISDALDLEPGNVDLSKRRVTVSAKKDGEFREVWMSRITVPYMRAWYEVREDLGLTECPVFCSMKGVRMYSSYYRALLPELGEDANINKRIYADGIRHVFVRRAWEGKATQRSIQLQFGHDNITTTAALLERLGLHSGFSEFEESFGK